MTPEDLSLAKYNLDVRRFRFDRAKAKREQRFLFRNSAVLMSGALSLAAVVVSISSVLNTRQSTRQHLDFQMQETIRKAKSEEQATLRAANETDRKGSLELLQYITVNYDLIYSNKTEKQTRIRNAMELSFPSPALARSFARLAQSAPTTDGPNVWQEEQRKADDAVITGPLKRPIGGGLMPLPTTREALLVALTGQHRRIEAERLAKLEGDDAVNAVGLLLASLLPQSDRWSYRFNLYSVYTLAKVPRGWAGTPAQLSAVEALKRSGNYRDPTFKSWVDDALKNYRRAGA